MVVLKNCDLELSHILAVLVNMCLKESCFTDCWKISSVFPVFKTVGERSTAKNYRLVSLLFVSKIFEKLVNNRFVDLVKKCDLVSNFQYGFKSSTADLLTILSGRIARTSNRYGVALAEALHLIKAFDKI